MLITRRNYDEVMMKIMNQTANAAMDYIDKGVGWEIIQRNKLICDMVRPKTKFFLGRHIAQLVNLTEYYLRTKYHGLDHDKAMFYATHQGLKLKDNVYHFHYYNTYDYAAKKKELDPWGHDRSYIHVNKVEGFYIHNVIPQKQTVIASILFYDKYNVYQSQTMQFSKHRGLWYMRTPDGSYYSNLESNINILYNIQNY